MLGSLARKLRALGFDATYYRAGEDAGLLEESRLEGRTILTSDRRLADSALGRGRLAVLLTQRTDGDRLAAVAERFRTGPAPLIRGEPRCSVCNGELKRVRRGAAAPEVPQKVLERHRLFFRCTSCGQVYWHGSHWKKLRSLARRLGKEAVAPHTGRRQSSRPSSKAGDRVARRRETPH